MWLLGLVLLLTYGQLVCSTDYCSIKCMNDVPHTMCQYKASPSSNCQGYQSRKLSEDDVKSIVNQHNKLRSKVAIGKEQGQPSAANMLQLTWDNELAQIAQRWADQCNFNHDKCRDVDRFLVGQNIAINYRSDKYASEISQHIDRWYEEVAFMKQEFVSSYPEVTTEVIGHYTQLVYAETCQIGCAVSRFIMKDMFAEFLVCNYGPAGNMLGGEVYKIGSPCSQCPEGLTCSNSYPGLCHTQGSSGKSISTDDGVFAVTLIMCYMLEYLL